MRFTKICLPMVVAGSISLIVFSCAEEEKIKPSEPVSITPKVLPDLSDAIQKRVEEKPEEAVALLDKYNKEFPDSPKILIQLSRALIDLGQFSLAAFRLDQAISAGGTKDLLLESAEAHELAGDLNSAQDRLTEYLKIYPENPETWLSLARILNKNGIDTEALNAFEKASEQTNAEDCILMGNLYLKKKIYVQAEHWFRESAKKESVSSVLPLLGLLRVNLATGDENSAEALILAIEKSAPKSLENSPQRKKYEALLVKRRLSDFAQRGVITQNLSISELAQALLQEPQTLEEPVVSSGPKLAPLLSSPSVVELDPDEPATEFPLDPVNSSQSLAEAFASPQFEQTDSTSIELGWSAYLEGNYATALQYARDAIKENNKEAEAWRLSSQAHFQLGQIRDAEMTILEAIRHAPDDLMNRIDYLNISRETLSSTRYLRELEKTHERFPNSGEILWQLARRYHIVERMPVTAGILYRKLLKVVPEGSGLYLQAEMELLKIKNL
jgi:tetratricopeptide (TPR) repeat protein